MDDEMLLATISLKLGILLELSDEFYAAKSVLSRVRMHALILCWCS